MLHAVYAQLNFWLTQRQK